MKNQQIWGVPDIYYSFSTKNFSVLRTRIAVYAVL